ncbi:hypothetical protein D1007_24637 [Hordeum vulgare]|nr:hypothetical protein D1007_24637 [Hordeum vulgare]
MAGRVMRFQMDGSFTAEQSMNPAAGQTDRWRGSWRRRAPRPWGDAVPWRRIRLLRRGSDAWRTDRRRCGRRRRTDQWRGSWRRRAPRPWGVAVPWRRIRLLRRGSDAWRTDRRRCGRRRRTDQWRGSWRRRAPRAWGCCGSMATHPAAPAWIRRGADGSTEMWPEAASSTRGRVLRFHGGSLPWTGENKNYDRKKGKPRERTRENKMDGSWLAFLRDGSGLRRAPLQPRLEEARRRQC